ncbi:MAG: hypothetical protein CSA45_03585 [Gammaproteobacteria bacterium]|nr:MAG: hypothetical protein CSA45_03585 [Gammaproteobacteria bacterium]
MRRSFRSWMLPEGVVEAMPLEAEKLNALEQMAIATFSRWGYRLLRPPMFEYADTFVADDKESRLAMQTIQFRDQKSGKQLGFRADMTPQIARIDGHYLKTDKVARYAYVGEVVRSYPAGHGSAKNPTIAGVELLGSASQQADIETVSLLIDFLSAAKVPDFLIELGNVDIVIELLQALGVNRSAFGVFFEALAKKDSERLHALAEKNQLDEKSTALIASLVTFYGGADDLKSAMVLMSDYPAVKAEIKTLYDVLNDLQTHYPGVTFHVDLSDVHGFGYHNGLIFSAYVNGVWQPIARGGRYDSFGQQFVTHRNVRPSIGFSCHLNLLMALSNYQLPSRRVILCPLNQFSTDDKMQLNAMVRRLRSEGDTVVNRFDDGIGCHIDVTHQLEKAADGFVVTKIDK